MASASTVQPEWFPPQATSNVAGALNTATSDTVKLKVYNSLTRSKVDFVPIQANRISWYCCGPTVYDASHMGHARNYVSTDILRRVLRDYFGYNVFFVQNVTDIDDKIILRARQSYLFNEFGKEFSSITAQLVEKSHSSWVSYIETNLPAQVPRELIQFRAWLDDNAQQISQLAEQDPKFPMHLEAVKSAHQALTAASTSIHSIELDQFLTGLKSVLIPVIDNERASSVSDPEIFRDLPAFWEKEFDKDMRALNVLPPTVTTRVSEYIPEIIEFVEKIVQNGYGYASDDGSVYFDTVAFENSPTHVYAKLQPWNKGKQDLIDEGEGSLSKKTSGKRSKNDFALWKASKIGEPAWKSPWGDGRPGWHIECSVMASEVLGSQMDIHSGGVDLAFPHHDNELAQSEAFHENQQWVNYFMHTGHLHIQGQKMSKSLKNFITIQEALEKFTARQLRLAFAMQQWNTPFDFKESFSEVKAYEATVSKFFSNVKALIREEKSAVSNGKIVSKKIADGEKDIFANLESAQDAIHKAFCDNLSVPVVLSTILDLIQKTNVYSANSGAETRVEVLHEVARYISRILGILGFSINEDGIGWSSQSSSGTESVEEAALPYIQALSSFRDEVRSKAIEKAPYGEFLSATDKIRNQDLLALGVSLDDRGDGKPALIKFLDEREKADLIAQQQEKELREQEKLAKKLAATKLEEQKKLERIEKGRTAPEDLFRVNEEFSEWDESGIPLSYKDGLPVSKSQKKKLLKQFELQKKLHEEYLTSLK